jgi:uncharacterized RDD family membrane protein YckC
MHCQYCRTWNDEDEHRCQRCGRRLKTPPARPAPETYPVNSPGGALAAATAPAAVAEAPRPSLSDRPDAPRQGSLFQAREAAKIIPFRVAAKPEAAAAPASKQAAPRPKRGAEPDAQPTLDFIPPPPRAPRTLKTSVEAVIYCDAPVATALHRAVAAALDLSMILVGVGLFLTAFLVCGGSFSFTKPGFIIFSVALLTIAVFYGTLWMLAGRSSAGMRWTGLRLVNFDGFPPERGTRWLRFASAWLSCAALGLGLLWALVDEESLTWHDHISKTFPTPEAPQCSSFRRF